MYFLIVVIVHLLLGKAVANNARGIDDRIYKGISVPDGQFAFMIYILAGIHQPGLAKYKRGSGSLIKLDTVLTAAHVVDQMKPGHVILLAGKSNFSEYEEFRKRNDITVLYKSDRLQESTASQIILHSKYKTHKYDVAVVKTAKPFRRTRFVDIIEYTTDEFPGKMGCFVFGFGQNHLGTHSALMYFTTNEVHSNLSKCGSPWRDPHLYCVKKLQPSICQGDSGGPLLCMDKIYGVSTFFYSFLGAASKEECGEPGVMHFFKLSYFEKGLRFLANFAKENPHSENSGTGNVVPQFSVFITCILLTWQ